MMPSPHSFRLPPAASSGLRVPLSPSFLAARTLHSLPQPVPAHSSRKTIFGLPDRGEAFSRLGTRRDERALRRSIEAKVERRRVGRFFAAEWTAAQRARCLENPERRRARAIKRLHGEELARACLLLAACCLPAAHVLPVFCPACAPSYEPHSNPDPLYCTLIRSPPTPSARTRAERLEEDVRVAATKDLVRRPQLSMRRVSFASEAESPV